MNDEALLQLDVTSEKWSGKVHRESELGGLAWYDEWLRLQSSFPDWRPKGYYEKLSQRYGGRGDIWKICEEMGWEKAVRKIVLGYLNQLELATYLEEGDIEEFKGPIEILKTFEDGVVIMESSSCSLVLEGFREKGLLLTGTMMDHSYKNLIIDLTEKANKHWLCEMYALFVIASDSAHCSMIPWKYE